MKKEDKTLENQAWDRMEGILDQEMPVKKSNRSGLFWWIGLCALVLMSIFAYANHDIFSDDSDVIALGGGQAIAANSAVENKTINSDPKSKAEDKSKNENASYQNNNDQDDEEVKLIEETIVDTKEVGEISQIKNLVVKYNLPIKESVLNNTAKNISSTSDNGIKSVDIAEDYNQGILNKFDTSKGRADIKKNLNQVYGVDYSSEGFNNKESTIESEGVNVIAEHSMKRVQFKSVNLLPISNIDLIYYNETIKPGEEQLVNVLIDKGNWLFGGFGSFQYLDKYFRGFDVGVTSAYNGGGKFSVGMKIGYEKSQNTQDPVLSNARVGVVVSVDDFSPELSDGSIFNSTQNAGFELNDVILSMNNLMMETTVSYRFHSKFSLTSGLGYKRLMSISSRLISGLEPQDGQVNVDFNAYFLDSQELLQSESINRNRFYIPLEAQYSPIDKVIIGIGSQMFINKNFEEFDEGPKSLYARLSFMF